DLEREESDEDDEVNSQADEPAGRILHRKPLPERPERGTRHGALRGRARRRKRQRFHRMRHAHGNAPPSPGGGTETSIVSLTRASAKGNSNWLADRHFLREPLAQSDTMRQMATPAPRGAHRQRL